MLRESNKQANEVNYSVQLEPRKLQTTREVQNPILIDCIDYAQGDVEAFRRRLSIYRDRRTNAAKTSISTITQTADEEIFATTGRLPRLRNKADRLVGFLRISSYFFGFLRLSVASIDSNDEGFD